MEEQGSGQTGQTQGQTGQIQTPAPLVARGIDPNTGDVLISKDQAQQLLGCGPGVFNTLIEQGRIHRENVRLIKHADGKTRQLAHYRLSEIRRITPEEVRTVRFANVGAPTSKARLSEMDKKLDRVLEELGALRNALPVSSGQ